MESDESNIQMEEDSPVSAGAGTEVSGDPLLASLLQHAFVSEKGGSRGRGRGRPPGKKRAKGTERGTFTISICTCEN